MPHYGAWLHYRIAAVFSIFLIRNIYYYNEDTALTSTKTQASLVLGTIATASKRHFLFLKVFLSKQTRHCQRFIFYSSFYNSCKNNVNKNCISIAIQLQLMGCDGTNCGKNPYVGEKPQASKKEHRCNPESAEVTWKFLLTLMRARISPLCSHFTKCIAPQHNAVSCSDISKLSWY